MAIPLHAQTNFTWVGGGGIWTAPANWNPPGIPGEQDTVTIPTGDPSVNASATVAGLQLTGGNLSSGSSQALTVLQSGTWAAGTISSMKLVVGTGCTFTLAGASAKTLVGQGAITNLGTVTWTGGPFNLENNARFLNQVGAVFDVQTDAALVQNGAGTSVFQNEGTYLKSAGSGTNTINLGSFVNSGLLRASSGTVRLSPYSLNAAAPGNAFLADEGASLQFATTSGQATFTDTTFGGAGVKTLNLGAGTATVNGGIAATNLVFAGGNWQGQASLIGSLEWSGGLMNNAGLTITAGSSLVLSGPGAKQLIGGAGGVITNLGTVTWIGGSFGLENNARFVNQAGALFDVQTDAALAQNGAGTSVFRNEGTYRKSAGTGTNTINVASFVQSGTLAIDTGVVKVVGDYTQGPGGTLQTRVAGQEPGAEFGQLRVTGKATLGGTLAIARVGGNDLSLGQTLPIVAAGSVAGTFAALSGSALGNDLYLAAGYPAGGVTLRVSNPSSILSAPARVGSEFRLQISGVAGQRYGVEASTNLIAWVPLGSVTLPGSGTSEFMEADIAADPYRFYRSVFLP